MRDKTYHAYLDSHERQIVIHSLVELKNQLIQQGRYIYLYEVDQQYLLRIPFASDEAQLGVTGEDLLVVMMN